MKLYFRMFMVLLKHFLNPTKIDPRVPFEKKYRVLWNDLDIFSRHLTNSRYTSFLDLVSLEFMLSSGLIANARKHRYAPVIGATYIRFRKELDHGDIFIVKLKIAAIKDGWVYMDYTFVKDDVIHCHAIQRAGFFKSKEGLVPVYQIMNETGYHVEYPDPPLYVRELMRAEDEFKDEIKQRQSA